jgi:hypothetical protein
MIRNNDEAKILCSRYGIKLSDHRTVIVTANNSIYLSDTVDLEDDSEKFILKGGLKSLEAIKNKESEEQESGEENKKEKKSKK